MRRKAVVLLSGGLDSTTSLYAAIREGYECFALTLQYGQLHHKELEFAARSVSKLEIEHHVLKIELPWKGSALLDDSIELPKNRKDHEISTDIPVTYVPARNTLFLSFAASYAETIGAEAVYIGANILDYSGYPDCRPEFFDAFTETIAKGTKQGVEGHQICIKTPLLKLSKKEIIQLALELSVPLEDTWSCYQGGEEPCGECDSCLLRAKGFEEAGVLDPLLKHASSTD